jgi:hypothetical protein
VGGGGVRVEREGSLDDVDGVVVLGAQAAVAAGPHRRVDLHPPAGAPPSGEARGELGGERSSCGLGRRRDSAAWPWTRRLQGMGSLAARLPGYFGSCFCIFLQPPPGEKYPISPSLFSVIYIYARAPSVDAARR